MALYELGVLNSYRAYLGFKPTADSTKTARKKPANVCQHNRRPQHSAMKTRDGCLQSFSNVQNQ
jgi:hypothetical protein